MKMLLNHNILGYLEKIATTKLYNVEREYKEISNYSLSKCY